MLCVCLPRGNFLSTITDKYIKNCNFDMVNNTYCPIFRVGDVVRYAQQNFTRLADKVESSQGRLFASVPVRNVYVSCGDGLSRLSHSQHSVRAELSE